MATRVGLLVSSVAIQSLLAYLLLPTGRGEFAVCTLFGVLLGVLFTPGADVGAQYFVLAKKISVSQGVSASLVICLIGSGIAATLAIPLIHSEITFFQKAEPQSFHVALLLIPLTTFSNAMQHHLSGLRRFARIALFSVLQAATNALGVVSLVLGLGLGVQGALLASCSGYLVMIIVCLGDLRRSAGLTWKSPSRLGLSGVLGYGIKYYTARIVGGIDAHVGVLLLGMMATTSEIGLFAVASSLTMRFIVISNAVSASLLPRAVGDPHGRPELVAFCSRITTWVTGASLLLLVAFNVPLVRILLSAEFLPSVPLIRTIAPGILVFSGGAYSCRIFGR